MKLSTNTNNNAQKAITMKIPVVINNNVDQKTNMMKSPLVINNNVDQRAKSLHNFNLSSIIRRFSNNDISGIDKVEIKLQDVFKNEILMVKFKEHCLNENSIENLLFLEELNNYTATNDSNELLITALNIKKIYLDVDAIHELNISNNIRNDTINKIKNADVSHGLFRDIKKEIFNNLMDTFSRFEVCIMIEKK
jgi:predicted RecB family endonuclease